MNHPIPSIGRRVWYTPRDSDGNICGDQPFDAGVIFVHP